MYFPVDIFYISANLLKIAVKKLNLSINFIKNELLQSRLLRILRASIYEILHVSFYGFYPFSLLVLALVKCTSCFSYPWVQNIRIAYCPFHFELCIIISYFLWVKDLKNTFETTLSCNVGEVLKTILLISTAYLGPMQGLRGSC